MAGKKLYAGSWFRKGAPCQMPRHEFLKVRTELAKEGNERQGKIFKLWI